MGKAFNVDLYAEYDKWGNLHYQEVEPSSHNLEIEFPNLRYSVSNLTDCPEDATIDRDLFSAYQYVDALRLGMRIAQAGFDEIDIAEIRVPYVSL